LFLVVVLSQSCQQNDRLALRRSIPQADDREASHGLVRVCGHNRVEHGPDRVDDAGTVLRQKLHRQECRASGRRALVVEPTPKELELLPEAELADRPIGNRTLPIVAAPGCPLELVGPLLA
jgi:hypothetical protein